jgi:hypothetical protein
LLLIDTVGALERDEQPFFFILRRAAQRFLVASDERDGRRAAPGLGGPFRADFGMLTMNYKRATPPARLAAGEPREHARCKALGQHNDRAMPGVKPGRRFTHVVQERRRQQFRFSVALPAQCMYHIEAVTLIGDAHPAKEFLRIRGQDLVGLAQILGRDVGQQGTCKLAHAVEGDLQGHGDSQDSRGLYSLVSLIRDP